MLNIITPTQEQKNAIEEKESFVVLAIPGSGKTFVLAERIKIILPDLKSYQGIIAISFTNKASDELTERCLSSGLSKKKSFFGTNHKFYLSEIIIPFGKHLFGQITKKNIDCIKYEELNKEQQDILLFELDQEEFNEEQLQLISELFKEGLIVLQLMDKLALYILRHSITCKKYLQSRYTHIIVDEYQDSRLEQHKLFLELNKLKLITIAVGDPNQSIFEFAGSNSDHLLKLSTEHKFKTFTLSHNLRSHSSIVNFTNRILDEQSPVLDTEEQRVFRKNIHGNIEEIANWISEEIPTLQEALQIEEYREICIITKNNKTAEKTSESLKVKHKVIITTPLDEDTNLWSTIFKKLIKIKFDENESVTNFLMAYVQEIKESKLKKRIKDITKKIKNFKLLDLYSSKEAFVKACVEIASEIYPNYKSIRSIKLLETVVESEKYLESYVPPKKDEVVIMTIHKSKGLEFDLVFNLDLYEWILPQERINDIREREYVNYNQDLNLFYVAVTRARKCYIACLGSKRYNFMDAVKNAKPSSFFSLTNLNTLIQEYSRESL